jgi:hypothetical protein
MQAKLSLQTKKFQQAETSNVVLRMEAHKIEAL